MKTLDLSHCTAITPVGLRHLEKLKKLEALDLRLLDTLKQEDVDALKKALPKCQISAF